MSHCLGNKDFLYKQFVQSEIKPAKINMKSTTSVNGALTLPDKRWKTKDVIYT